MRISHTTYRWGFLVTLVTVAVSSQAQQVTMGTPYRTASSSFFENSNISWSGNYRGINFSVGDAPLGDASFWLTPEHRRVIHQLRYPWQVRAGLCRPQLRPGLQSGPDHADAVGHGHERPDGLCVRHVTNAVRDQRCPRRRGLSAAIRSRAADPVLIPAPSTRVLQAMMQAHADAQAQARPDRANRGGATRRSKSADKAPHRWKRKRPRPIRPRPPAAFECRPG